MNKEAKNSFDNAHHLYDQVMSEQRYSRPIYITMFQALFLLISAIYYKEK